MTTARFGRITERVIRCREMSATDWRVYACIALHADASGRAYPSMATIAEMTGLKRKNVPRTTARLERFRILTHEPSGPNGTNVYLLTFDEEVSSAVRTGVLNGEDRGCPQPGGQGVLNAEPKVSSTLRTKHTKEQTNEHKGAGGDEIAGWFGTFWDIYPDRGDETNPKKAAQEKFVLALKRGADPSAIIRGAKNYRRVMARHQGENRRLVKQAVSWLHNELWEQYQAPPASAQPNFGGML
jgi:hypothetical protein